MPREQLRVSIEQLRKEIDSDDSLTPDQVEDITEALEEIEAAVDGDGGAEDSVFDKLRAAEDRFEDSHPNPTLAVGAVANALSKLGI